MALDIAPELESAGAIAWSVTDRVAVGAHRSTPATVQPDWDGTERHFCLGISETPCDVEVEGEGRTMVGPDIVRFHNVGDRIRSRVKPDADCTSTWVLVSENFVGAVFSESGARQAGGDGSRPFATSFVKARLPDLAELRAFFRRVESGACPTWVEEKVAALLPRLLGAGDEKPAEAEPSPRQRELALQADRILAHHYAGPISLGDVAKALDVSAPHLTRVYRAVTGRRLHSRLSSLRLAAAMERLAAGAVDLTGLGLDLGYADHSHFTAAFRRAVGIPPSAYRAACATGSNIR